MKLIFGDIKSLRASQKAQLEALADRRVNPREIVNSTILKSGAQIANQLGVQIGLLITRDGQVTSVIVGTKNRIYLPDLGRYRLDKVRLRRLRFVVFMPDAEKTLVKQPRASLRSDSTNSKKSDVLAPVLSSELRTDLEKLRFDAVVIVAVSKEGVSGAVTLAYLEPVTTSNVVSKNVTTFTTTIGVLCGRDLYDLKCDFVEFIKDIENRIDVISTRLFDTSKDQAVLVGVYTNSTSVAEASMAELVELASTAGLEVRDTVIQRRRELDPRTVVGKGKLEDIVLHCLDLGTDLLVFDRELTPAQLRSITNLTELRVLDRSMLILDIFAQRAKSKEGRLQVELAQLKYSLPRLTDTDTGLSRLTGGIGGRGPGETKLEIGRRRARDRITALEKQIDQIADQRGLRRERRQTRGVPVIAIVGYTNAGKSTLLNALTKGDVFVEGKLFATLDPASRRMRFPNEKEVVFVDTVGFIRELPKELMSAFRATLEEVGEADLLIHLADATNPELQDQIQVVTETLKTLTFGDKPRLLVLNKCDGLSPIEARSLANSLDAKLISAMKRDGLSELISCVQDLLTKCFMGRDPGYFLEFPPCV